MPSSGMLRCVALLRTDVSGEFSASIMGVTRLGELGTTLAVATDARRKVILRENGSVCMKYQIDDAERSGGNM
jgi:hypothetical protein